MGFTTGPRRVSDRSIPLFVLTCFLVLPDVWLTGGAEYFNAPKSLKGKDYYKAFQKAGYHLVHDKKELLKNKKKDEKLMGIFRKGNLDV